MKIHGATLTCAALWGATALAQCDITATAVPAVIAAGQTAQLSAFGGNFHQWSPAIGLSSTSGQFVDASPTVTTTYTVSAVCPWLEVSMGFRHVLAIHEDHTLWAWGYNGSGQLGTGGTNTEPSPVQIGTDNDWVAVAAGNGHSVALKSNGTMWAWGENLYGQVGQGTDLFVLEPLQVGTDTDWWQVAAGSRHTIALRTSGTLWGWGENASGQLGDGTFVNHPTPFPCGTATDWTDIDAQGFHSMGLKNASSTLWVWGDNNYGQVGNGSGTSEGLPVQVLTNCSSMSAGYYYCMAIKTDGSLWAWGNNVSHELGQGNNMTEPLPVQVGTANDWSMVDAGFEHTLGIRSVANMYAWGANQQGELGTGDNLPLAVPTFITNDRSSVHAGNGSSLGRLTNGTLLGWGGNADGQLGNGNTANTNTPVTVIGSTGSASVTVTVGPVGLLETNAFDNTNPWPNPVAQGSLLNVDLRTAASLVIRDVSGRAVLQFDQPGTRWQVSTAGLSPGSYVITGQHASAGVRWSKAFVVQ
ncbi:MAG: hypothetical protein IPJ76_00430 [Flavobacteriales bacterium]|nr:MAG: hypothetical protein IPJ76_00430 [Flavobacteriales bacterium]